MAWDWPGAPCNFAFPHYTNDCRCGRYFYGFCEAPPFYNFPGLPTQPAESWAWLEDQRFLRANQFAPTCFWAGGIPATPATPNKLIFFRIETSIINPLTHADVVLEVRLEYVLITINWENRLSQRIALANLPYRSEAFQFFPNNWTPINAPAPFDAAPVGGCIITPVYDHCDYP